MPGPNLDDPSLAACPLRAPSALVNAEQPMKQHAGAYPWTPTPTPLPVLEPALGPPVPLLWPQSLPVDLQLHPYSNLEHSHGPPPYPPLLVPEPAREPPTRTPIQSYNLPMDPPPPASEPVPGPPTCPLPALDSAHSACPLGPASRASPSHSFKLPYPLPIQPCHWMGHWHSPLASWWGN